MGTKNISRMTAGILTLLAVCMICAGCGGKEVNPQVYEEVVQIDGVSREYEIIFLADSHISLCDERDPELMEKAAARYEGFRSADQRGADETFQNVMKYVKKEQPDYLLLGGDIIDSAMWASIDFVTEQLKEAGIPYAYSMGNHDFEYGSEYYSAKAYEEYLPRLNEISEARNGFQTVDFGEFVVFLVDDECNRVSEDAVNALEELMEANRPVIVVTHVPIEPMLDDVLWQESILVWGASDDGKSRVLLGNNSCYPDENTRKFLNLILDENSTVQLVLAGHIHFYHRDKLNDRLIQTVTGACFNNEILKVTVKPAEKN